MRYQTCQYHKFSNGIATKPTFNIEGTSLPRSDLNYRD